MEKRLTQLEIVTEVEWSKLILKINYLDNEWRIWVYKCHIILCGWPNSKISMLDDHRFDIRIEAKVSVDYFKSTWSLGLVHTQ